MSAKLENWSKVMAQLTGRDAVYRRAAYRAVVTESNTVKATVRGWAREVFPKSRKAPGAVRSKVYGTTETGNVTAIVYSKFGIREDGVFKDFLAARVFGTTARPKKGRYMALPIPSDDMSQRAARKRFERLSASGKLTVVDHGGEKFLIWFTRTRSVLVAMLVKSVTFPRRHNLADAARGGAKKMVADIKMGIG